MTVASFKAAQLTIIMATYCLVSTTNAAVNGWTVYAEGTKAQCEKTLDTDPQFNGTDIWADTLRKNAKIVSKTKATRNYKAYYNFL